MSGKTRVRSCSGPKLCSEVASLILPVVGEVERRDCGRGRAFLLRVERMLWRIIFYRERAYAALKYDPGSCQNAKRARFGLSVSKMRGAVFGTGARVMRAGIVGVVVGNKGSLTRSTFVSTKDA